MSKGIPSSDSETRSLGTAGYKRAMGETSRRSIVVAGRMNWGDEAMHVALGVALGSIVVAPFIGKWRANVWLRNREQAFEVADRRNVSNVIEIA